MSGIDPAGDFGGLRIGGLQLALPMSALREVVPCGRLERLPVRAEGLLGAIDLRGVLVPVLDLRPLIGLAADPLDWPCVVLVIHDGLILGLLCEGVTGVFRSEGQRLNRAAQDGLMAGSLRRADDGSLLSVLSPAALLALPGLPRVEDPEPQRQRVHDGSIGDEPLASGLPMLLLLCGRVPLALPAMAVHATLPSPQVCASVLAGSGACVGVLEHAGEEVPVVDLPALCGLGRLERPAGALQQAFLMRLEAGLVAFLIDRVLDVVRVDDDAVLPVPAFALPRRELFEGGLAIQALTDEVRALLPSSVQQFLVLSPQGLQGHAGLQALAASGRPVAALRGVDTSLAMDGAATAALQAAGQRAMVTYQLGREVATPIGQIREILPFGCEIAVLEVGGAMLGLVAHRGRSIPVMCLSRLHGLPPPEVGPAVSVLVVEADAGEQLGFAVPMLRSIEPADWEPALPALGDSRDPLTQAIHSRQLVQVGQGDSRRMLQVVDLQRIARALQQRVA